MPTYLCHGFRWLRRSVRVYVILQNLDDASPEWIIPARTSQCILRSFYEVFEFLPYCTPRRGRYSPARETDSDGDSRILDYASSKDRSQSRGRGRSQSQSTNQSRSQSRAPQLLPPLPVTADDTSSTASLEDDFDAQSWSAIKLLEEYDPRDLTAVSRPYAYVADYAVRIDLSCSIGEEIARYEQQQLQSPHPAISIPSRDSPGQGPGWFEQLRDQLQRDEEIGWYVVVNNDEVRDWADERSEPESISRPDPGYQQYQYQQKQQRQQRQQQSYQYQYQPPINRPTPTREQKTHHAQYIHQQMIFEKEQQQQQQQPQQPQQPIPQRNDQPRNLAEEKRRQQLLFEKSAQQRKREEEQHQQQILALKEQEPRKEREREREREKERERQMERERLRLQDRERENERERERQRERQRQQERDRNREQQRAQKPSLDGPDPDGKPPMVPEKDYYHFPRPPTANTNAKANPKAPSLKPKMSIDAGLSNRPKTPGNKASGLRRLFGRGKVQVDGSYSP